MCTLLVDLWFTLSLRFFCVLNLSIYSLCKRTFYFLFDEFLLLFFDLLREDYFFYLEKEEVYVSGFSIILGRRERLLYLVECLKGASDFWWLIQRVNIAQDWSSYYKSFYYVFTFYFYFVDWIGVLCLNLCSI